MPTRFIQRKATLAPDTSRGNANACYVDSDDNVLKFTTGASGTTEVSVVTTTQTQTLTNKTLTSPTITGLTSSGITPASETTASRTLGAADVGRWTLANRAAGVAFTLPAATGTGDVFSVAIGTVLTSGSVTVTCAGSDTMVGYTINEDAGDTTPADATIFATVNGTTAVWTSAFTGGGGEIGDHIICVDIATGRWLVRGFGQKVLDSTASPFS